MGAIGDAVQACRERIRSACQAAGRSPDCAALIAVSKTFPAEAVRAAHQCGQRQFGESYLQEALPKLDALADLNLEWHFIGPMQSNKTRQIAERFDWVHGVCNEKIARRLSEQRPDGKPALNVCIQVNVSGETSKHGVSPAAALDLAHGIAALPNLRLRGFMTIPAPSVELAVQRAAYRILADLLTESHRQGMNLDSLSMGMSADIEAAVLEGATLVRVGTAIFGSRPYNRE